MHTRKNLFLAFSGLWTDWSGRGHNVCGRQLVDGYL